MSQMVLLPASTPNLQHGVTSPIRTSVHPSSTKARIQLSYSNSSSAGILNASGISYSNYRSTTKTQPHRTIVRSAFEADKLCLGDFASSSATWLSDYESDGPTYLNTEPSHCRSYDACAMATILR
ncbi:hypothetical protein C8R48DRAFT_768985 [Suillus tomentosus]|nr:hypothetical protein C8R48DRAFT_768985 [Suillus tomentosus]